MSETFSFLPVYDASIEQNKEYLRQCLLLMTQNNVAVNPINYAIWYEYVAGTNQKLVQEINALVKNKSTFGSDITTDLYKRYLCPPSLNTFEQINQRLQQLITHTSLSVESSRQKATQASDKFEQQSQVLAGVQNQADFSFILSDIISETKQLAQVGQSLKQQLENTNKEMEQLRGELVQVREAARMDGLTGLLNRRSFDSELAELVAKKQPMTLAILDLDHFKRINDSFGHQVGDKVLKYFASLLIEHAAKHHYVARYGGEEMAMIMPDTQLNEAVTVLEKIRKFLESSNLKRKDNTESIGKVTVSVGVTELKLQDTTESFIERADQALYKAKETGRNKVIVAGGGA